MALASTEQAATLALHAMVNAHRFDPNNPDMEQLSVALIMLSTTLNQLVESLREDETAAGQVAPVPVWSRGPMEGNVD